MVPTMAGAIALRRLEILMIARTLTVLALSAGVVGHGIVMPAPRLTAEQAAVCRNLQPAYDGAEMEITSPGNNFTCASVVGSSGSLIRGAYAVTLKPGDFTYWIDHTLADAEDDNSEEAYQAQYEAKVI